MNNSHEFDSCGRVILYQSESRIRRTHELTLRLLKDLYDDVNGLHPQLTAAHTPTSASLADWHTRQEIHGTIDRLVHRAGVLRGRVRETMGDLRLHGHTFDPESERRREELWQIHAMMEVWRFDLELIITLFLWFRMK